jgi:hypothetical protein
MGHHNSFMGVDNFIWWMGVIENRNDPLKLNRIQIRIFGWHTENKISIPTIDLPWAQPVKKSSSSYSPQEGDMAFGFFADGENGQYPVYLGTFSGIPSHDAIQSKGFSDPRVPDELEKAPVKPISRTLNSTNGVKLVLQEKKPYPRDKDEPNTSRLSRRENLDKTYYKFRVDNRISASSVGKTMWNEPYPPYNTTYPYNSVSESESGHSIEMDDTPNAERISITHRTGTGYDIYPSGTKLEKIVKDNYSIVHGSDFCYINGKLEVSVENVAKIRIKGKTTIEIDGDVDWKIGGKMNLSIGKELNIKTGGTINYDVTGDIQQVSTGSYHAKAGGSYDALVSGKIAFDGNRIDLNSGIAPGTSATGIDKPNAYNNPDETVPALETIRTVDYGVISETKETVNVPVVTSNVVSIPANTSSNTSSNTSTQPILGTVCYLTEDETRALLSAISSHESGSGTTKGPYGNGQSGYKCVNNLNYLGKYQFGAPALITQKYVKEGTSMAGLSNPNNWTGKNGINSKDDFLNNPDVQEAIMFQNMKNNCRQMSAGGLITPNTPHPIIAGHLMAAHLVGAGGENTATKAGTPSFDANGTSNVKYYKIGYNAVASVKV